MRAGSTVSDPSARNLDTGEALKTGILRGDAITRAGIPIDQPVAADTEIVVIWFPAVAKGRTTRLRIEETYTDAGRYGLVGDELVWNRGFGRPSNEMVLPEGWYLTASSMPAVVSREPDGRVRLTYVNPRPDSLEVFVKARRRGPPTQRSPGAAAPGTPEHRSIMSPGLAPWHPGTLAPWAPRVPRARTP